MHSAGKLQDKFVQIKLNEGLALYQGGQLAQAYKSFHQVLETQPQHFDALYLCGVIAAMTNNFGQAIELINRAIEVNPNSEAAYYNRANALNDMNQHRAAIDSYDKAIALKPDLFLAYTGRGNSFRKLMLHQAAIDSYDKAIAIKPDYAEAYYNRGNAHKELKQYQAAVASYDQAIAINPNLLHAHSNRGNALCNLKQYHAAIDSYGRAIALKPDYAEGHWNQGLCYLQIGDFERGWVKFEWRWQANRIDSFKTKRSFSQPLWLGTEPLQGKTLLLHCEQGLGDTIQFCRYATLAANRGARVILEVQPPLRGLLAHLEGVAEVATTDAKLPAFDYHCPLLSLPLAFKTNLDTIPSRASYLTSDPLKVAHWKGKLGDKTKRRVGLVWSGSAEHANDGNRSISLADLAQQLPDSFQYVSLQKELRESDRHALTSHPTILHFGEELRDFTDTAALCELVDVVVSVDTSVAHLAGALGKPVWIALAFNADWRWLLDRSDSPWYPSAKLERQEAPGDWSTVFGRIAADLEQMISNQ